MNWTPAALLTAIFLLIIRSAVVFYQTQKFRSTIKKTIYSQKYSYESRLKYINAFENVGWWKHFWRVFLFQNVFNLYCFDIVYFYFLEQLKQNKREIFNG